MIFPSDYTPQDSACPHNVGIECRETSTTVCCRCGWNPDCKWLRDKRLFTKGFTKEDITEWQKSSNTVLQTTR
jgi:hypothetical protein